MDHVYNFKHAFNFKKNTHKKITSKVLPLYYTVQSSKYICNPDKPH